MPKWYRSTIEKIWYAVCFTFSFFAIIVILAKLLG